MAVRPFPGLTLDDLKNIRVVVTHSPCTDGYASRSIVKTSLEALHGDQPIDILYLGCVYKTDAKGVGTSSLVDQDGKETLLFELSACTVLTVDCALPAEWHTNGMLQKTVRVLTLDHHIQNQKDYAALIAAAPVRPTDCFFDMDRCGCQLVWDMLHPHCWKRPSILDRIGECDLFRAVDGTVEFKAAYYSKQFAHFDEVEFNRLLENNQLVDDLVEEGRALRREQEILIPRIMERAVRGCVFYGHPCTFVELNNEKEMEVCSEVGHLLAVACGGIGIFVFPARDSVKLRSEGELDVAAIAKKHGGGGHKNAAGFPILPAVWEDIKLQLLQVVLLQ